MQFGIRILQEVVDYVVPLPGWVRGLEGELRILLVAFSREANIVELNFIYAGLSGFLGQGNVVGLYFLIRSIGPNQLAVLTPRLTTLARLHCQLRMMCNQRLIPEYGYARDRMHPKRVQETCVLVQVLDWRTMTRRNQLMIEIDVHPAIAVLDIENDGIAANLSPLANNVDALLA